MKIGDKVKVVKDKIATDYIGCTGTITNIIQRFSSFSVEVIFDTPSPYGTVFKNGNHFDEDELEVIE